MPLQHFHTVDGVIITFDDNFYVLNAYNEQQWEIVRLSTQQPVLTVNRNFGTHYLNFTGVTNSTFLGRPRLTLPNT